LKSSFSNSALCPEREEVMTALQGGHIAVNKIRENQPIFWCQNRIRGWNSRQKSYFVRKIEAKRSFSSRMTCSSACLSDPPFNMAEAMVSLPCGCQFLMRSLA